MTYDTTNHQGDALSFELSMVDDEEEVNVDAASIRVLVASLGAGAHRAGAGLALQEVPDGAVVPLMGGQQGGSTFPCDHCGKPLFFTYGEQDRLGHAYFDSGVFYCRACDEELVRNEFPDQLDDDDWREELRWSQPSGRRTSF